MRFIRFRRRSTLPLFVLVLSAGLLGVPRAAHAQPVAMRSTAEWLVDLGRSYALSDRVTGGNDDALIILSYMEAATRLDPSYPDAYLWQFELLGALGRDHEALMALEKYVELRPQDLSARLLFIRLQVQQLSTIEQRRAFCQEKLADLNIPDIVRAELHFQLAQIAFSQLDEADGVKALEAAVSAYPWHMEARRALEARRTIENGTATPIDETLFALEMNPLQPGLVWATARQLSGVGLYQDAVAWYDRALALYAKFDPAFQSEPSMLVELATAQEAAGDLEAAMATCQSAIDAAPGAVETRLMMMHIGEQLGRDDLIARQRAAVRSTYDGLATAIETARAGQSAAEIALYYAYYDLDLERAKQWLDRAREYAPNLPIVAIVSGFIALDETLYDEATQAFQPFAATSQLAAIGMARVLIATGKDDEAVRVLTAAADLNRSGPAFVEIRSQLQALGRSIPPLPAAAAYQAAMKRYDEAAQSLAADPETALEVDVQMENARLMMALPWRCRVRIKNVSDKPVFLGHQGLLNPQLLLSFRVLQEQPIDWPAYLWLSCDMTPVLAPGETIEQSYTIDVGPFQRMLTQLAQRTLTVDAIFVLDAIRAPNGDWRPSPAGRNIQVGPIERVAVGASDADMERYRTAMGSDDAFTRVAGGMMLASLAVGQRYKEASGRPGNDATKRLDARAVVADVIRQALSDPMPQVRARSVNAIRWYPLASDELGPISQLLSDKSWLVRMLAISVLAEQQGQLFLPVVEGMAQRDPDRLLKQYCGGVAGSLRSLSQMSEAQANTGEAHISGP